MRSATIRRRRRSCTAPLSIAVLVSVVATACGSPSTTARPTSIPAPTTVAPTTVAPTPSPIPTIPTVPPYSPSPAPAGAPDIDSLPKSASLSQDGIKLTLTVSSNPLRAGWPTIATVTLENRADRELRWTNDGCDVNAWVHGRVEGAWRPSEAANPPDLVGYRDWFLREARADSPIGLAFDPLQLVGRRFIGCADLAVSRSLAPGRSVTQEFAWDGSAEPRLGLPPTAPATLTATFERWTRPGPGRDGAPLVVTLDSWVIDGRRDEVLSPAEVIDAALMDERFAASVRDRRVSTGNIVVEYDMGTGLWTIGFLRSTDDGDAILHAAHVDPLTGEVIAVREQRVEL